MNKEQSSTPRQILNKIWSFRSPKSLHSSEGREEAKDKKVAVNVIVMGADCVGKSVFLNKDKLDKYEIMEPTLGATYSAKTITLGSLSTQLRIWDTNGHEKYRSTIPIYITNDQIPKLCIIFYDVTDRKSFDQVESFYKIWSDRVGSTGEKDSVMIVANKVDNDYIGKSDVSSQEGLKLAKKYGVVFLQSSSLFDVSHIFNKAVQLKFAQIGVRCSQEVKQLTPSYLNASTSNPQADSLTFEQKQKLIKLILSLEDLKARVQACKFQNISNKYYKIIQFKLVWQQKLTSLKTLQFSLKQLRSESKTNEPQTPKSSFSSSTHSQSQTSKTIEILEYLRSNQLSELKKIQKIIVGYLPQEEEYKVKMEELKDIKQAYSLYKKLSFSTESILINSELVEFADKIELFQTFMETFVSYVDSLDNITTVLQGMVYRNLQQTLSESSQTQSIKQLISSQIALKCLQTPNDPILACYNPIETKQQRNMAMQSMIKKDQKFVQENLKCIEEYLRKVRGIVERIVKNDEELLRVQRHVQEHNAAVLKRNWRLNWKGKGE